MCEDEVETEKITGARERGVEDLYKNHITLIPDKYLLMRQETWKIWSFSLPEMGNGPHVRKIKFFEFFSLIGGLKGKLQYLYPASNDMT
jgi:hypothetical protein